MWNSVVFPNWIVGHVSRATTIHSPPVQSLVQSSNAGIMVHFICQSRKLLLHWTCRRKDPVICANLRPFSVNFASQLTIPNTQQEAENQPACIGVRGSSWSNQFVAATFIHIHQMYNMQSCPSLPTDFWHDSSIPSQYSSPPSILQRVHRIWLGLITVNIGSFARRKWEVSHLYCHGNCGAKKLKLRK